MKHRKFIKIINIVLIAVFVMAAFNIEKIYYDYNRADNTYEGIQDEYVSSIELQTVPDENTSNPPEQTKVLQTA